MGEYRCLGYRGKNNIINAYVIEHMCFALYVNILRANSMCTHSLTNMRMHADAIVDTVHGIVPHPSTHVVTFLRNRKHSKQPIHTTLLTLMNTKVRLLVFDPKI